MKLMEGAYGTGGKVLFFDLGKYLIRVCVISALFVE